MVGASGYSTRLSFRRIAATVTECVTEDLESFPRRTPKLYLEPLELHHRPRWRWMSFSSTQERIHCWNSFSVTNKEIFGRTSISILSRFSTDPRINNSSLIDNFNEDIIIRYDGSPATIYNCTQLSLSSQTWNIPPLASFPPNSTSTTPSTQPATQPTHLATSSQTLTSYTLPMDLALSHMSLRLSSWSHPSLP